MNKIELKKIRIKNFKSLEDFEIDVKDINLLFGVNGSGKSSFFKALMFLFKNLNNVNYYDLVFLLNEYVNLENYESVVTDNDITKKIEFILEYDYELYFYKKDYINKNRNINFSRMLYSKSADPSSDNSEIVKGQFEIYISIDQKALKKISLKSSNNEVTFYNMPVEFEIDGNPCHTIGQTAIRKYSLFDSEDYSQLLNYDLGIKDDPSAFNKELIDIGKLDDLISNNIQYDDWDEEGEIATIRYIPKKKYTDEERLEQYYNVLLFIYLTSVYIPTKMQKNLLIDYQYIPQVREVPKIKYILHSNNISGNYYGEIFREFSKSQARFLGDKNIYKNVKYRKINKILKNSTYPNPFIRLNYLFELTGFEKYIFVEKNKDIASFYSIDKHDNKTNLANECSGIVQLMPILIMLALEQKGILLIEQPELHLHPRIQSNLAKVFQNYSGKLFIETHSEHLIRKMQVLIASDRVNKLNEKVAINFLDKENGKTINEIIELDDKGLIKNEWPNGFFDDSLNLTIELSQAILKWNN